MGGNDTVTLPHSAWRQLTPSVSWDPLKIFHGGPGNDTIVGGDGDDRISGDAGNDKIRGGEGGLPDMDTVYLSGKPSDYAFSEGDPSWLSAYNTKTTEKDLISADVEFVRFEAFGDNAVSVNNVHHELAKLANRSYKDTSPAQDGASGWRPMLAQELGLSPRATDTREYGIKYEMRDGIYRSFGATSIDPFGVVAHVSYAKVNGTPTLAVAFRGTTDFEDGLEFLGFSKYYDRYKPLVDAIKHYVQETNIPKVYVTGHSLGGAMAQMFMQETGVLGDDRYFGVTFGSPGAPKHAPDPRMFHFEHTDDRVVGLGKLAHSDDLPLTLKALLSIFTEVRDYDTSGQAIRKVIPGFGLPNTEHAMDLYEKTALLSRSGISGKDTGTSSYVDGELVQDAHHYASEIHRLYQSALDRLPDMDGLVNWIGALKAGMTLKQAAGGFTDSTEFRLHYGAPDDAGFVKQLYLNVLDREADAGGLSNWTKAMSAGMTRAEALVGFSESAENIQRMAPVLEEGIWVRDNTAATVARLYDSVLDRLPDAGGLGAWTDAIKAGMGLDQAADGFTGSPEFQQRYGALDNTNFVKTLYRNVLDREAEPGGLANWRSALDAGVDRSDIVLAFSESAEHVMKLAPRIDDGIWLL
ncbi:hypothetical protein N825_28870 [Skermanella stibiiresistens SB22]|uniref:Fungal lipase-like domain-containing protein n=2 Tax=Skermanella TaxID=204447 RepID=W9GV21_9PROT|nr:hypothetical protein N825_28870 [Skermanella stibiiresistens SB22]